MAFLGEMIGPLLSALFGALFKGIFDFVDQGRRDAENQALGAERAAAKANQAAAETLHEMDAVPRPSDDEVEKRLAAGTI